MVRKTYRCLMIAVITLLSLVAATIVTIRLIPSVNSIDALGFEFYKVSDTKSMEPNYRYLDLLVVVQTDFYDVNVGDVISFEITDNQNNNYVVSHMVIDVIEQNNDRAIVTEGINSPAVDQKYVTIDGRNGTNRFLGKVVFHNRPLGLAISYFTSIYGIVNVLVWAAVFYIFKRYF